MGKLIQLFFGGSKNEQKPAARVTDFGAVMEDIQERNKLNLKTLPAGARMVVKTVSGSVYHIQMREPDKGKVVVQGNPKYFPRPTSCVYLGAVTSSFARSAIYADYIVDGMCMEFADVPSASDRLLTTSCVMGWHMVDDGPDAA